VLLAAGDPDDLTLLFTRAIRTNLGCGSRFHGPVLGWERGGTDTRYGPPSSPLPLLARGCAVRATQNQSGRS